MGRLPSSFRSRNQTSRSYRDQYAKLPARIQDLIRSYCRKFDENPNQPTLRRRQLNDNKRGQHHPQSWSVSITMKYRAIYVVKGDTNVWYWVGTHAEYDTFTGGK